jgi:hypothetical protein
MALLVSDAWSFPQILRARGDRSVLISEEGRYENEVDIIPEKGQGSSSYPGQKEKVGSVCASHPIWGQVA